MGSAIRRNRVLACRGLNKMSKRRVCFASVNYWDENLVVLSEVHAVAISTRLSLLLHVHTKPTVYTCISQKGVL